MVARAAHSCPHEALGCVPSKARHREGAASAIVSVATAYDPSSVFLRIRLVTAGAGGERLVGRQADVVRQRVNRTVAEDHVPRRWMGAAEWQCFEPPKAGNHVKCLPIGYPVLNWGIMHR